MERAKRTLDGEDGSYQESKKASIGPGNLFKMLVPNINAGTIIGKQGLTIGQIQSESGARVKLSQSREFFPGTSDRVVLIQGSLDSLRNAASLILDRIYSNPEQPPEPEDTPRQVKLAVPSIASGSIIGRGGDVIRRIQEQSGSRCQLAQKDQEIPGIQERIVTVNGTLSQCKRAVTLIIDALCEVPDGLSYQNITTTYLTTPSHSPHGAHSPVSHSGYSYYPTEQSQGASGSSPAYPPSAYPPAAYSSAAVKPYGDSFGGPYNTGRHAVLSGYSVVPRPAPPPAQPPLTYSYPLTAGANPTSTGIPQYTYTPSPFGQPPVMGAPPIVIQSGMAPPPLAASGPRGPRSRGPPGGVVPNMPIPASSAPLPGVVSAVGGATQVTIPVPEELVGAILGQRGAVVMEIQQTSGARVQLSQKGEFMAGTRNRILSITGTQASCETAQYLVAARLREAEMRGLGQQQQQQQQQL